MLVSINTLERNLPDNIVLTAHFQFDRQAFIAELKTQLEM